MAKTTTLNRQIKITTSHDQHLSMSAPVYDFQLLLKAISISLDSLRARVQTAKPATKIAGMTLNELHERLLQKLLTSNAGNRMTMRIRRSEAAACWLIVSDLPVLHQLPGISQVLTEFHKLTLS